MNYTNIRYSVMLNDTQYEYLSDDHQGISRMKCFHTFLKLAAKEETAVSGKGFSAVLQPGQFIASKVELSEMWKCNRKTAIRIVGEFNRMGILQSVPTNRTTVHTLKSLSVWFTTQKTIKNSFFTYNPIIKPSGTATREASHATAGNGVKAGGDSRED